MRNSILNEKIGRVEIISYYNRINELINLDRTHDAHQFRSRRILKVIKSKLYQSQTRMQPS